MSDRTVDGPEGFDQVAMTAALRAAVVGLGAASPNPAVGAVIALEGQIVAEGGHRRVGERHAEVVALSAAGSRAAGATAYVTLEPCSHVGRQPPCTEGLIKAGIAEVVYGIDDPDQRVAGRGAAQLSRAGVKVRSGLMAESCRFLNPGYLHRQRTGRARLVLKTATTLDGAVATSSGQSQWITGAQARRFVHELRARMAAVMVGAGTARADSCRLNVRLDDPKPWWFNEGFAPHRIVVSGSGDCPAPTGDGSDRWLLGGTGLVAGFDRHLALADDWAGTLAELAAHGINEVLCEGGAGLASSLLQAGVVDEWIQMVAPMTLRGSGLPAVTGAGVQALEHAQRGTLAQVSQLGQDACMWTVFDDAPSFADQTRILNELEPR